MHIRTGHGWTLVALLVLILAVFAQSYQGRVTLVNSQRAACKRGILDRQANAAGWWEAERARMDTATDPTASPRERSNAREAADLYGALAAEFEARASIDCTRAFPAPSPLP